MKLLGWKRISVKRSEQCLTHSVYVHLICPYITFSSDYFHSNSETGNYELTLNFQIFSSDNYLLWAFEICILKTYHSPMRAELCPLKYHPMLMKS